jgi:hypothetical protein
MWADFPGALSAAISDPQVRDLVERWPTAALIKRETFFGASVAD